MIEAKDLQAFADKIKSIGLPHEKVTVFGRINLNVHVLCKSRTTADKWALALNRIDPTRKITCTKTLIERANFKRDAANQQHIHGWLVAL